MFAVEQPLDLNIVIEIVSNRKLIKFLLMSKTLKFSLSQIPITWDNFIPNEKKKIIYNKLHWKNELNINLMFEKWTLRNFRLIFLTPKHSRAPEKITKRLLICSRSKQNIVFVQSHCSRNPLVHWAKVKWKLQRRKKRKIKSHQQSWCVQHVKKCLYYYTIHHKKHIHTLHKLTTKKINCFSSQEIVSKIRINSSPCVQIASISFFQNHLTMWNSF